MISLCSGVFSSNGGCPTPEEFEAFMRSAFPVSSKEDVDSYIKQIELLLPKTGWYFVNTCDDAERDHRVRVSHLHNIPYFLAVNESYVAEFSFVALTRQIGMSMHVSLADTFSAWMEGPFPKHTSRFTVCYSESITEIGAHRKAAALLETNEKNAYMTLYPRGPFLAYLKELKEQELGSSVEIVDAFKPVVDLKMKIAVRRGDDFINVGATELYAEEVPGVGSGIVEESKADGGG